MNLDLDRNFLEQKFEQIKKTNTSKDMYIEKWTSWAELDLNQRRHIANEFTVRPH